MNTTENLISTGCPPNPQQPLNQVIKPIKFPAQPQEWKIVSLRECPTPDTMQHCETPDQAAAYWKEHIVSHPYFNSECECLVVFILNTIWCPLARWIQFSVIPGRYSGWPSWQVHPQSSSPITGAAI
jgi:hypothetical protein